MKVSLSDLPSRLFRNGKPITPERFRKLREIELRPVKREEIGLPPPKTTVPKVSDAPQIVWLQPGQTATEISPERMREILLEAVEKTSQAEIVRASFTLHAKVSRMCSGKQTVSARVANHLGYVVSMRPNAARTSTSLSFWQVEEFTAPQDEDLIEVGPEVVYAELLKQYVLAPTVRAFARWAREDSSFLSRQIRGKSIPSRNVAQYLGFVVRTKGGTGALRYFKRKES